MIPLLLTLIFISFSLLDWLYWGGVWLISKPLPLIISPLCKMSFISISILLLPLINDSKLSCCKSVWLVIDPYPLLTSPLSTYPSIFSKGTWIVTLEDIVAGYKTISTTHITITIFNKIINILKVTWKFTLL